MSNTKENTNEVVKSPNIIRGKGINLIPPLSKEEIVVQEKKFQLNIGASIAMLFFIILTIAIVGFNIIAKVELNSQKNVLYKIENSTALRENVIASNDEILKRALLYKQIESTTYSSKDMIVYFQTISKGLGNIDTYEISDGSSFIISGSSASLTDVSKFWYLLGNDKYIESVNLKSVVKGDSVAKFTFEGKLNIPEFKKIKNG